MPNSPVRIVWLTPYCAGHVAAVVRGIHPYPSEEAAQAQIARYRKHWPHNRYHTEPFR